LFFKVFPSFLKKHHSSPPAPPKVSFPFPLSSYLFSQVSESPWVECTLRKSFLFSSALPYTAPSWVKLPPPEVIESICRFIRKVSPSQIVVILCRRIASQIHHRKQNFLRILKSNSWLQRFQKICTISSRRLSRCASISGNSVKIEIQVPFEVDRVQNPPSLDTKTTGN
jgi:hypothetical protein